MIKCHNIFQSYPILQKLVYHELDLFSCSIFYELGPVAGISCEF